MMGRTGHVTEDEGGTTCSASHQEETEERQFRKVCEKMCVSALISFISTPLSLDKQCAIFKTEDGGRAGTRMRIFSLLRRVHCVFHTRKKNEKLKIFFLKKRN